MSNSNNNNSNAGENRVERRKTPVAENSETGMRMERLPSTKSVQGVPGGTGINGETVSKTQYSETVLNIVINNEDTGTKKGRKAKPSTAEFSKVLGPLYAILLILVGILFPTTEALQSEWLGTIHNMIYIVYTLSVATLFVIYFEWYIMRQKRRSHKRRRRHDSPTSSSRRSSVASSGSTASSAVSSPTDDGEETESEGPRVVRRTANGGILIQDAATAAAEKAKKKKERKLRRRRRRSRMTSTTDAESSNTGTGYSTIANGRPLNASVKRTPSSSGGITAMVRVHSMSTLTPQPQPQQPGTAAAETPTDEPSTLYRRRGSPLRRPPSFDFNRQESNSSSQPPQLNRANSDSFQFYSDDDDDDDEFSNRAGTESGVEDETEDIWIDLSKLGSVFSHEGSSLYLRLGLLVFAIGNLVYIGLEIESRYNPSTSGCFDQPYGWTYFIRLVFILFQTYFVFKNALIKVHGQEWLIRFGLMHMVATNMSVWLRTLINEIMNEYNHYVSHANITEECSSFNKRHSSTSTYLFPFVLEYSLIALGMLAVMYASIDTDEHGHALRGIQNLFRISALDKSSQEKSSAKSDEAKHGGHGGGHEHGGGDHEHGMIALVKSHRGLFLGILILAGCGISILMFYFESSESDQTIIYLSTDITLSSLMLIGACIALFHLHRLSYIARPLSVDDMLMVVAMAGSVMYEMGIMMASGDYIAKANSESDVAATEPKPHSSGGESTTTTSSTSVTIEALRLSASLIAAIQSVIQVILVLMGLRRYPSTQRQLSEMPGRGTVTFLIIVNVCVWIVRTALAKALSPSTQFDYYGPLAWLLLLNINLPLLLFFRFHSSVCLADIWHSAYTSPVEPAPAPAAAEAATSDGGDKASTSAAANCPGVSTLMRSYSLTQLAMPAVPSTPTVTPYRPSLQKFPVIEDVEVVEES